MTLPSHEMTVVDLQQYILKRNRDQVQVKAEELRAKLDPEALTLGLISLINEAKTADLEELERLKFQADIYKAILKKCLPDLKAIETKEKIEDYDKLIIDISKEKT